MPIPVRCPGCQANFKAPDQMAGRAASCPKCQTKLQIPALAPTTALPQATALPTAKPLPVATAIPTAKPPQGAARPMNGLPQIQTAPTAPSTNVPVPAEPAAAKESILKKRWTIDKILINGIAVIIFLWFMGQIVAPVLFTGMERNKNVQPKK